jgi:hypothetical protein
MSRAAQRGISTRLRAVLQKLTVTNIKFRTGTAQFQHSPFLDWSLGESC